GERLGGEVLVVRRDVGRGVRVARPAGRLQPPVELLGPVLLRAVEHHVLEQVADPGDPRPLVARADAEEAVEGGGGKPAVGPKAPPQYAQTPRCTRRRHQALERSCLAFSLSRRTCAGSASTSTQVGTSRSAATETL